MKCWVCGHINEENNIIKCTSCGHIFRNYGKIDLQHYYSHEYRKRFPTGPDGKRLARMRKWANFRLDMVSDYVPDNASFFEVGFGWGVFHEQLKKRYPKINYSCCEISTDLSNKNKKKDIKTYNCAFQDLQATSKFDVVASFDVLEHLHDPNPYKHKLLEVMKPGSLAIIQVPTDRKIHFRYPFDGHYHYFSKKSLRLFMKDGFEEVIFYKTERGESANGREFLTAWRKR